MADNNEISYRKGALEALVNEKMELSRLLNIVNSLIENHAQVLSENGIDVEEFINSVVEKQKKRAEQAQQRSQNQGRQESGGRSGGQRSQQGGQRDRKQGGRQGQPSRESRGKDFAPGGNQGGGDEISEDLLEPGDDEW